MRSSLEAEGPAASEVYNKLAISPSGSASALNGFSHVPIKLLGDTRNHLLHFPKHSILPAMLCKPLSLHPSDLPSDLGLWSSEKRIPPIVRMSAIDMLNSGHFEVHKAQCTVPLLAQRPYTFSTLSLFATIR